MRILVITNDFPPRVGGINDYVDRILRRFPPGEVTIFASSHAGAAAHDAGYPHEVIRQPTEMLLPTPAVSRRVHELIRSRRPDVVLFGASMPLALMGPGIRRRHGVPYVGFTFGLEVAAARVPGGRALLARIGRHASALTAISDWTGQVIRPFIGDHVRLETLPSGIDAATFRPDLDAAHLRRRHGLGDGPVICCVSRIVVRKGHDMVIRALPRIAAEFHDVRFLIVGQGPSERRLHRLTRAHNVERHVVFAGAVSYEELPFYFRVGDVFAMPCRSRLMGLEVEGLGAVFLQASAVGRPVLVGDSGGAPEAVRHGETGLLVDPRDPNAIGDAILRMLRDPDAARRMGEAGAAWMHRDFTWEAIADRVRVLLTDATRSAAAVGA